MLQGLIRKNGENLPLVQWMQLASMFADESLGRTLSLLIWIADGTTHKLRTHWWPPRKFLSPWSITMWTTEVSNHYKHRESGCLKAQAKAQAHERDSMYQEWECIKRDREKIGSGLADNLQMEHRRVLTTTEMDSTPSNTPRTLFTSSKSDQ